MTTRERKMAKAERLRDWAGNRERKANAVFARNEPYTRDHAFNTQPGHIPMRARIIAQENRAFASLNKATDMRGRAAGIENQIDRTVYSDDNDAIERLEGRIRDLEAQRDRKKEINRLYRKGDAAGLAALGLNLETLQERMKDAYSWEKAPYASYELTGLGARIRTDKARIEEIKRLQARHERAETAGGMIVEQFGKDGEFARITFAEKPDRVILTALKAAGFYWGAGCWSGYTTKLPQEVTA